MATRPSAQTRFVFRRTSTTALRKGEYNETSCNDGAYGMLRDDPMLERMTIAATGVASQYQRPHS
jgi:hypothetical protein